MIQRIFVLLIFVLVLSIAGVTVSYAAEKAPSFTLPKWDTEEQVSLDDFKGKIIVLDFFNAGCPECLRTSWELQIDIQEFYNANSGNPHGIEVQVVAVNSEICEPDELNAFLDETELDFVLGDCDGKLLQRYGGATVPYVVVIDAAASINNIITPVVVYRSDYEGSKNLRRIIDGITGNKETNYIIETGLNPESQISLPAAEIDQQVTHETAIDMAILTASDVFLTDTLVEFHRESPAKELTLAVTHRHMDVDYSSEYLEIMRTRDLTEDFMSIQVSAGFDLNKNLTLTADGGFYNGFQTYRALWLDEFYRQMFDTLSEFIDDLEGYEEADPWGYNVSSSLRWEYIPSTGIAEAGISFQHDVVSPGYEAGNPVVRLRDTYNTISGHIAFENIITRRMRSRVECRIDDISDRELRFTFQAALNYALAENLVTRVTIAGAKENPHFRSKSISALLERDWHGTWFVSLFGRYYEDTSEIANAIVGNASAPPLESFQAGLGIRRQGARSSFKLAAGPYFSKYDRQPERDMAFDQLYKDRDWISVQAAFVHQF